MAFKALEVAARDHVSTPPVALAQLDTWLRAMVKTERRFTIAAANEIEELRAILEREMQEGAEREAALALELLAARGQVPAFAFAGGRAFVRRCAAAVSSDPTPCRVFLTPRHAAASNDNLACPRLWGLSPRQTVPAGGNRLRLN
jgi:hypothetical protein